MADVVIAVSSAHVNEWTQIISGRLYMADDPIVRAHPGLFDADIAKYAVGYTPPIDPVVDRAPRGPGRPRKEPVDV